MNKEKKKDNIFKSSFFLKLFGIPYGAWFLLLLIAMIPNETNSDSLTWEDFIYINIVILLIWFIISFVIALIVNETKKNKPKIIKEVQYVTKPDDKIVVKQEDQKNIPKIETKKKGEYLYTCESIVDAYEYKKMSKYFPQIYWAFVSRGTLLNLVFCSIIAITSRSLFGTLISFVLYQALLMILYKARLEHFAEKNFYSMQKKGNSDTKIHIEFYDDYFTRQDETTTYKINYFDIDRCVETDTNFYLKYGKKNIIIFIQKNQCEFELINFIRDKFKNLKNHLKDSSKFKSVKNYHHPNFINNAMIILFILTIVSLWGGLYSVALVNKINPQHGFNFTKNAWVFWCWLPIPILSIILGFKNKNAGFKCTKNIVGGFIIGFLLLVYGAFCLFPTFSEDYNKIDSYRNIIDAKLPNNGELEIQDWDTYLDEDKTEYTIMNAYYNKEDISNLVSSIENNNNWVLSKKIKSELKIFVPSQLSVDDDAYFSIYNKTLNEYNTLPENEGNYEIYAMKYDKSDKHLEIHKFKYYYK